MKVVDVGASPGGWCQVVANRVKSKKDNPTVVGVDLLSMLPMDGVTFIQGDIEEDET